ncbi:hypothetical protein M9H77_22713 [Catharanthus roseus]|uniref:Uncharacterized protein n=1 Tax=Catharanthus roseus TaxID=4058 RepID=A0ACC0ASQ3_CATRO|nr:hypothetical protein M9H77_22713 [Catharanthus roseus]
MGDMRKDITNLSIEQRGQSHIEGHVNFLLIRDMETTITMDHLEHRFKALINSMMVVDTPLLEVEKEEAYEEEGSIKEQVIMRDIMIVITMKDIIVEVLKLWEIHQDLLQQFEIASLCRTFGPCDYEAWEQKVESLFYSYGLREEGKFQLGLKISLL